MLRHLGAILLAASLLHVWGVLIFAGALGLADPFSETPPLERIYRLFVLSLTSGGFQVMAGWYLWRRGETVVSEAVPFGALLLVRRTGTGFLVVTTVIEVAAGIAVILQDLTILSLTSVVSLPLLTFGFLLFWFGAHLPPPSSKEQKRPVRAASDSSRRRR